MRRPTALLATALAAATIGAAAMAGAGEPIVIDDPRFVKATILLEGGDPRGAIAPLESLAAERAGALYVLDEHFAGDRGRRRTLVGELATIHGLLATAAHEAGDSDRAVAELDRLLDVDPEAELDPLVTPRALVLKLAALREERLAEEPARRFELPDGAIEGIEHAPPLFVVRGSGVTLYARVESGAQGRITAYWCEAFAGAGCEAPRRLGLGAAGGDLFATTIPSGATVSARELRYRIEVTDAQGRRRSTPWFPLAVVDDVNQHIAASVGRYGPRAEARLRAGAVVERLGTSQPWPEGVERVDSQGASLERYRAPY